MPLLQSITLVDADVLDWWLARDSLLILGIADYPTAQEVNSNVRLRLVLD